ncbi:MAG: hypothetical protein ACRD45_23395 [Bryobacteraceae bacterium]
MKIKSYFANSVQEAMEKARAELGAEAMLVHSKNTDAELRHLGAYEVVFGVSAHPTGAAALKAAPEAATPERGDALLEEMAELRRQIEGVKRSVSRQSAHLRLAGLERWPELEKLYEQLLAADFSSETAQDLVQAARRLTDGDPRSPRASAAAIEAAVSAEIERRLLLEPEIGEREPGRKVALFTGPPGCGKTSLLVKVAVAHGVKRGIPVQILSTDTLRVGAVEQLSAYAHILGAGFQAVHTVAAFARALEEHRAKKLVLIDTPGYAANEMEDAQELAGFVSSQRRIEVHLLLPTFLRQSVLARTAERFQIFAPAKLAFTHFDEAGSPGAVLDQALRSGLPVSFLSSGQKIPEDIAEASKAALLEGLWEPAEAAAVSAA